MNVNNPHWQFSQDLSLKGAHRWEVYRRLQELEISCSCRTGQPLRVNPQTPTDVALLWSVARCHTADRDELLCWLDRCWTHTTANKMQ